MVEETTDTKTILRPRVLTGKDMFLYKTFDNESMMYIFKEFVESNPEFIKQVLDKTLKDQ